VRSRLFSDSPDLRHVLIHLLRIGLPEIFKFTVRSLEHLGVSAVIIEDKEGLKQNSLLENSDHLHKLADVETFCEKISAGIAARRNPDFMIIARMESLVAGRSVDEALYRANASVDAGASGVMIHSRKKDAKEIMEFIAKFRCFHKNIPVVVVPSSYNTVTEFELGQAGASIVIYANQLLRSAYPSMMNVASSLLDHSRAFEAEKYLLPIKEITSLIQHDGTVKKKTDTAHVSKKATRAPFSKSLSRNVGNGLLKPRRLKEAKPNVPLAEFSCESLPSTEAKIENTISPAKFVDFLRNDIDIDFFTGVPDSCIKKLGAEIDRQSKNDPTKMIHAIAANEGAAIGMAVGHYLATSKLPLVYMQNSGLGNAVNPLLSAAHPEVYGIPMIMVLGWRGSPGVHDEPQHLVTGRQTRKILAGLEIETFILPTNDYEAEGLILSAREYAMEHSCPVAVLVKPDTFSGDMPPTEKDTRQLMSREQALTQILDTVHPEDIVVATTGFTSRELFELREARGESHSSDFLCVGSMGHAIAIAQGIAIAQPTRTVWCLDGDGASLMHMGSMALSASFSLSNLRHILINNEAHESVGGQHTVARQRDSDFINFQQLASSLGYIAMDTIESKSDIKGKLSTFSQGYQNGPSFLEIKVSLGARQDLGRPKITPIESRNAFMSFLRQDVPSKKEYARTSTVTADSFLLTPGPLTTSNSVKHAMLHDFGSRDKSFVSLTAKIRSRLVDLLKHDMNKDELTVVLLQGSGTFAVEAMIQQFVPPSNNDGKLLIFCNGAYGRRMAGICSAAGRSFVLIESPEDEPLDISRVEAALVDHADATHAAIVACETTTGVLNPVSEIASTVASHGRRLLVDAMSSFGVIEMEDPNMKFDALVASSNKGLQGSPGLGFVIANKNALMESAKNATTLSLDLYSQWRGFEDNGEWRFTPPTHCLLALAKALEELEAEGGVAGRRRRYQKNAKILVDGMRSLGFETIIPDEVQAPVIVTFRMPLHHKFNFQDFYESLSNQGYTIYPGKITREPTFRVGCIGHIFPQDMEGFIAAVRRTLNQNGIQLN